MSHGEETGEQSANIRRNICAGQCGEYSSEYSRTTSPLLHRASFACEKWSTGEVGEDHPHVCIYSPLLRILFATCSHFSSLRPFLSVRDGTEVLWPCKTFANADRELTRRFSGIHDQFDCVLGSYRSSVSRGADPLVSYLFALFRCVDLAMESSGRLQCPSFGAFQTVNSAFAPRGMGGLGHAYTFCVSKQWGNGQRGRIHRRGVHFIQQPWLWLSKGHHHGTGREGMRPGDGRLMPLCIVQLVSGHQDPVASELKKALKRYTEAERHTRRRLARTSVAVKWRPDSYRASRSTHLSCRQWGSAYRKQSKMLWLTWRTEASSLLNCCHTRTGRTFHEWRGNWMLHPSPTLWISSLRDQSSITNWLGKT